MCSDFKTPWLIYMNFGTLQERFIPNTFVNFIFISCAMSDANIVINTAGRPNAAVSGASFKIHHLSHITYRIKRIKISLCILSTNLITIA